MAVKTVPVQAARVQKTAVAKAAFCLTEQDQNRKKRKRNWNFERLEDFKPLQRHHESFVI